MISSSGRFLARRASVAAAQQHHSCVVTACSSLILSSTAPSSSPPPVRSKSTQATSQQPAPDEEITTTTTPAGSYHRQSFGSDGDVPSRNSAAAQEVIRFPAHPTTFQADDETTTPVLLNAREHAVGYLSKILNARVYDAAIETELQDAKNLSAVRAKNKH